MKDELQKGPAAGPSIAADLWRLAVAGYFASLGRTGGEGED